MAQLLPLLGGLACSFYLLLQMWAAIEQPLLEFVFLGLVPGTDYVIGFDQAVLTLTIATLLFALAGYRRYLLLQQSRTLFSVIELIAL